MYSNLEGSYGEDRKFRYYFLGTAYIFLFAALTTTLEYVIIFYGKVLPHQESYNTTYYALTAVGLIPLTIISAVHIFDGWEKCGMFEVGCLINATAFGIFTGISCIYGCNTPALPIAFGYVCLISFITYLLILLFPSCYLITTGIMIGVGLAGSIAYFIVFWKMNVFDCGFEIHQAETLSQRYRKRVGKLIFAAGDRSADKLFYRP